MIDVSSTLVERVVVASCLLRCWAIILYFFATSLSMILGSTTRYVVASVLNSARCSQNEIANLTTCIPLPEFALWKKPTDPPVYIYTYIFRSTRTIHRRRRHNSDHNHHHHHHHHDNNDTTTTTIHSITMPVTTTTAVTPPGGDASSVVRPTCHSQQQ